MSCVIDRAFLFLLKVDGSRNTKRGGPTPVVISKNFNKEVSRSNHAYILGVT